MPITIGPRILVNWACDKFVDIGLGTNSVLPEIICLMLIFRYAKISLFKKLINPVRERRIRWLTF